MKRLLPLMICLLCLACPVLAKPEVKIEILSPGKLPAAEVGDEVAIFYKVSLPDGTLVEENTDGAPFKVQIGSGAYIPGLSEGLVGLRRNEVRRLEIPAELAYGAEGKPPVIPPNSPLIFEVTGVYRSGHSHDDGHDHGEDGHSHAGESQRDGSQGRPSAESLERPAISEFLIRDFFTKPWRYDDAPQRIWRRSAVLTGLSFSLFLMGYVLSRRSSR